MAKNKTQPTRASASGFLNAVADESQRRDAKLLDKLFREVTGEKPVMWGPSIVGYGTYHYTYDSGREGEFMRIGFSPRKQNLTLYIMPGFVEHASLLDKLGKHTTGKSCLYVKRLADVDMRVLKKIVERTWKSMRSKYRT